MIAVETTNKLVKEKNILQHILVIQKSDVYLHPQLRKLNVEHVKMPAHSSIG